MYIFAVNRYAAYFRRNKQLVAFAGKGDRVLCIFE